MKKLISMVLCIAIIMANAAVMAETTEVEGLHEKLSALILENNFTEEQIVDMDQQYVAYFNEKWPGQLAGYKALGRMETNSDEEEYEYRLNKARPDFSTGIKATLLSNLKYIKKYVDEDSFSYLFGKEYWAISSSAGVGALEWFDLSGNRITVKESGIEYDSMLIRKQDIKFIKNEEHIKNLLLEQKEVKVINIKLFAISATNIFLYIQCEENEYLINLYAGTGWQECMKDFEQYKLYPAKEMLQKIAEEKEYIGQEKPTFETEALSLQEDGWLLGNENGLDLLKPLTRIEAATMLLRAIGEQETAPDSGVQTFSDVSADHWGYGAAERAASIGMVQGIGDGQFAPEDMVTGAQFATMILRAGNHAEFNWEEALDIFIDEGIISNEDAETMDLFTRGDMAKMIYEAIEKGLL